MAKISARNAHTIAQVRGTKPGDPDSWITLTLTSDGRLLRKITMAHRSSQGTHYSNSNNHVMAHNKQLPARTRDEWEEKLRAVASKLGYTEPK